MGFPQDPLAVEVELNIGGTWTDITEDTYLRDPISITRGRADWGPSPDPGTCKLTLDNRDGRYSPRNPMSPYYGVLGRNTPLRVSVLEGASYLECPGTTSSTVGASTPDTAALDITGDIDLRIDATLDNWQSPTGGAYVLELMGKWGNTAGTCSWLLMMSGGFPILRWSADGTTPVDAFATAAPAIPGTRRLALRATLDVNNGSGGWSATFYTAPTIAGPWTQLGATVTGAGTTSIANSTAAVLVGQGSASLALPSCSGQVHAAEIRNGIGGTAAANPDFTTQTPGSGSFADAAGRTWTIGASSAISNRKVRFTGEVSSWPPRWDVSGNDVYTPIEAAGITRRLGQGASPLRSVMARALTNPAVTIPPVAYWPCEDLAGATSIASGIGGPAMGIVGDIELASDGAQFIGSAPLPKLTVDTRLIGAVPTYTPTTGTQVRWLLGAPSAGFADGTVICEIDTTGTAARWGLQYGTGGTLTLVALDSVGATIGTSGAVAFDINADARLYSIELTQNGADVDYYFATLAADDDLFYFYSGTFTSCTVGTVTAVGLAPFGDLTDAVVGHLSVQPGVSNIFDLFAALDAYAGERPLQRVRRLCAEEEVAGLWHSGVPVSTTTVGAQQVATLLELLADAGEAEQTVVYERRDVVGLQFRERPTLYNQVATLALDYEADGEVAPPLEPTDDDQATRNDVTVTRRGGSSARAVLESGPLSVQAPPDGVGRYDEEVTLNVATDGQLPHLAGWRLYLGTADEPRYPTVHVDLAAGPHLIDDAVTVDVFDRVTITSPPAWLPPDDIDQMVQGYAETIGMYDWDIVFNCTPGGPWRVGIIGDAETGRLDTGGSTLETTVNSSAASLSVATTTGPLWTTDGGHVPFDIAMGGERITVTAVSGASSPQTFTVTRSVNGIVKGHTAGAEISLWQPMVLGL